MLLALTAIVAICLSLLALSKRNLGAALGILIMSTLIWPEYYRISLGIQFSVPRIIAMLLMLKLVMISRGGFKKHSVDKFVLFVWIWTILATIFAGSDSKHTIEMIGRGLDSVLMYFIARKCISDVKDMTFIYPYVAFTVVLMCGMGLYENITWHSPYHKFYFSLGFEDRTSGYSEIRHGLLRAQGSTTVSIYFGMAMMILSVFIWSMRQYANKPKKSWPVLLISIMGTFTCLSSGPFMGIFIFLFCTLYYKHTSLIKPTLYLLLLLSLMIEMASNRHFYNLIDYLAMDKATAYYRSRLLEVAVMQWRDYWLVGTGSNWPHHWATLVDQRQYIDIVNNFVIVAVYGGVPALLGFVGAHFKAIKASIRSFKASIDPNQRKLIFGLTSGLIAVDLASFSVGIYGPVLILSYILLGILVSLCNLPESTSSKDMSYV